MKFTKREKEVYYLRFEKNYTLKQISDMLGISVPRVQQISYNVVQKQTDLSVEQVIDLINSKLEYGRPRIQEWELVAIKKCILNLLQK